MISFDEAVLLPLIQRVIVATLDHLDRDRQSIGERLAYSEAEAAALLGIQRHVLRDARLRGEVVGCRVGKGIRYERDELLQFLQRRRGM